MPLTITLTPNHHDAHGHHGEAIQRAIDIIASQREGIVHLTAGTYVLRGPLRLKSSVRLEGEGVSTILTAVPFVTSALAADADVGQKEVHPTSTAGFLPGSGLILLDRRNGSAMAKMPLTVQHVQDGVLYIDDFVIDDWCAEQDGLAINYFPFIHAVDGHDITIADLRIDQKRDNDAIAHQRGIWGAGIYCQRVERFRAERLLVENCYGDGLRSGRSIGVEWISCEVRNNTHYGVHPGSHTKRVVLEDCHVHGNGSDGVYVCWGVERSIFQRNHIHNNGYRIHRNGFCIGHKDTDNLIENNHIHDNAKHGIHIRLKTDANGAHRNIFRQNRIEDNGRPDCDIPKNLKNIDPQKHLEGAGIFILGTTRDCVFENNTIRNRNGLQKRGIYVGPQVINPTFSANDVSGHEIDVDLSDAGVG